MVRLIARKRSTPCYGPIAGRSAPTPLRSAGRHRARGLAGQRSSTAEPPPREIFRRLADEIVGGLWKHLDHDRRTSVTTSPVGALPSTITGFCYSQPGPLAG